MKVILQNHTQSQSITEVLRMFFLKIKNSEEQTIYIEDSSGQNLVLYSSLSTRVSKEQMRDTADQTRILVSSRIAETDLKIETEVIPSAIRRELKRQTYYLLSKLTGIDYPWGSLSGIRPTQIVYRSFLENKQDRLLTKQDLIEKWYVSEDKVEIALKTAIREMKILDKMVPDLPLLYIGIPFCTTRCAYCSFITQDAVNLKSELSLYVKALLKEIREIANYFRRIDKLFQAIYVGGGTPTALSEKDFSALMHAVKAEVPCTKNCEITVEAGRPDSITETKLSAIKIFPNARICINPQTMFDQTLNRIGRGHNVEQVYQAYELARNHNFRSINMDLILGLPGEYGADFLSSLDKILKLNPESITIHTMALKRSAFLEQFSPDHYLKLRFPDPELGSAFLQAITSLQNHDYEPYYLYRQKNVRGGLENIGFAKKDHACIYNVGMMSDRISVIGLGSGSTTKIVEGDRVERLYNPKNLLNYIERIDELIERKKDFL